jgi:hypothetical protein
LGLDWIFGYGLGFWGFLRLEDVRVGLALGLFIKILAVYFIFIVFSSNRLEVIHVESIKII